MCEPVSMGIAAGAMLVGSGLSAYGQYKGGKEQAKADVANAAVRESQAADEIQRASHEARQVEIEGRTASDSARAALSKSNVKSESMEKGAEAAQINSMLDADQIRANAARQAWGYRTEAKEMRQRAKATRKAGILGAVSTGLSGAASAGMQYGSYMASRK